MFSLGIITLLTWSLQMTPLNQSAKCFTYRIGLQVNWLKAKFIHVRGGPDPPPLNIGPNGDSSFVFLGLLTVET